MENSAPGRHPLDVAGSNRAAVSQAVAMLDGACEHIRDGLDAAMRMPWKTGQIILRLFIAKVVEQEERVEVSGVAETERTPQMNTCTFEGRLGFDETLDWPNRHITLLTESLACY